MTPPPGPEAIWNLRLLRLAAMAMLAGPVGMVIYGIATGMGAVIGVGVFTLFTFSQCYAAVRHVTLRFEHFARRSEIRHAGRD